MHADLRGFVFSRRQLAEDLLNNGVSVGRVRARHQLKCAVRENDLPFLLLDLCPLCRRPEPLGCWCVTRRDGETRNSTRKERDRHNVKIRHLAP